MVTINMTVDTHDLTNPVMQDIHIWTSAQHHLLGYDTMDRSSGKTFRYSCYNSGSAATTMPMQSGVPVGPYVADANSTWTQNWVTDDASLSLSGTPYGIVRGSNCSATNIYGFVEVVQYGFPTSVLTSADNKVAQGEAVKWAGDGWLDTLALNSLGCITLCGEVLTSHLASSSQLGSTIATGSASGCYPGTHVDVVFYA